MKLSEIRLYKLKIIRENDVVFEGMSEELPEELKDIDSKSFLLENGEAIIEI